MTPKEEAKELVDKFDNINILHWTEEAKQCALICVDEILDLDSGDSVDADYWYEVKLEIKLLKK